MGAYSTTNKSRVAGGMANGQHNTATVSSSQAGEQIASLTTFQYSFCVQNSYKTGNSSTGQMLKEMLVRMSEQTVDKAQSDGKLDTNNGRSTLVPTTYGEQLRAMEIYRTTLSLKFPSGSGLVRNDILPPVTEHSGLIKKSAIMGLPQSLILLHQLHDILINVEFLYDSQLPVNISNYNKHDTLLKKSVAKEYNAKKILNSFSELYNNAIRVLRVNLETADMNPSLDSEDLEGRRAAQVNLFEARQNLMDNNEKLLQLIVLTGNIKAQTQQFPEDKSIQFKFKNENDTLTILNANTFEVTDFTLEVFRMFCY